MNPDSNAPPRHNPARRAFLAAGAAAWTVAALPVEQTRAAEDAPAPAAGSPWPARIKALTFDVFGTVTDWRTSIVLAGERLSQAKGLRVDWAQFAAQWRAGYRPALEQVERGKLPWTNIDGLHRRILDGLLRKFDIPGLSEDEIVQLNRVWHRLLPWSDAVGGLNRLRCRYITAALSNGSMALLVDLAKNAGLPWDCVLSAELAKHYKPAPEVYQMAARLLDLQPAQVMMVTAHADDLLGARRAGFQTAFVSRPLEHGPGGAPPQVPAEPMWPRATFSTWPRNLVLEFARVTSSFFVDGFTMKRPASRTALRSNDSAATSGDTAAALPEDRGNATPRSPAGIASGADGAALARRAWLKQAAAVGGGAALAQALSRSAAAAPPAGSAAAEKHGPLKIADVRTFLLTTDRHRLMIVKVQTDEPELYGLGCATFTQRARVVDTAVTQFLQPFLRGKNPLAIEDLWQSMFVSSYWRNGGVLNSAIAGVDMACWDILGKQAGLPVWQLLGGKARRAAETYRHVSGSSPAEIETAARKLMDQGQRHLRIQFGVPGTNTYGHVAGLPDPNDRDNAKERRWEPRVYCRELPRLFAHLRRTLGDEVELLHDVHERLPVPLAVELCKALEPYQLYFLEDPLSPEDQGHFRHLRQQTSIPLAMGELFTNPSEFVPLISERLIDFIRIHVSQIGGLTPARKVAALCEFFGVRTAWHGPPDMSPVGHACNLHLNLATPNFGIQEARDFNQAERDIFPGCPELKDGCYWANDRPGWGLEFDEKLAAKFPIVDDPPFDMSWGNTRRRDGAIQKP